MFADFSEIPLVVDVRSSGDGVDCKVNIKVIDDVWKIQQLWIGIKFVGSSIPIQATIRTHHWDL
jgi:hypothetical protein